jgi:hypothetical protein
VHVVGDAAYVGEHLRDLDPQITAPGGPGPKEKGETRGQLVETCSIVKPYAGRLTV